MANILEREKVRKLRHQGVSIGDIAQARKVSKSTVSYWCRNIELSKHQIRRLQEKSKSAGTRIFIKLGEIKRKERLVREKKYRDIGKKDVDRISKRDLFMLGVGLYWGEGYKHGNSELGFTNSDQKMIRVFLQWLYEIYQVEPRDIILRVSINEIHKSRIDTVTSYWSKIASIPKVQFTKPTFIKTALKKRYPNHDNYFGILRVKVRRGANLKQRILGSLERISDL